MIRLIASAAIWLCVGCVSVAQQGPERTPDEKGLLAADARQLSAVAAADVTAIDNISHPNLRVHAPNTRILTKEEFMQVVGSGQIRDEVAERTPESMTITGDIGVVMGREVTILKAGRNRQPDTERRGSTDATRTSICA